MIKTLLIFVFSLIAFYFIIGRKIKNKMQAASRKRFNQEQQRAAWREGYQKEKINAVTNKMMTALFLPTNFVNHGTRSTPTKEIP